MSTSSDDTLKLIRRAQGDDRVAAELLFVRYLPRLRRALGLRLGRRLGEIADVDDVCQDALLAAFEQIDAVRDLSPGCFMNWLVKIAMNQAHDHRREARAQKRGGGGVRPFVDHDARLLADSVLRGREPTPSQVARRSELEELLEAALLELSPRDRHVFELRALCGMSFDEIAIELGMQRPSSARTAYSRVLARLSASLPPELGGAASRSGEG